MPTPLTQSAQIAPDGFLRIHHILGDRRRGIEPLIPVCKSTWWAGIKSGRFPRPLKLGPRTTVWRAADIAALIAGLDQQEAL